MNTLHTEIHVSHTPEEAEALSLAGLPHITDEQACASCAAAVGCVENRFIPTAIVLNDEHEWLLCMRCVAPALWPRN